MGQSTQAPPATQGSPLGKFGKDLCASLVVFMVALPLCIAIAKACGLPAETGIIAGIVGGLLVGPLSGSPLQVSGPAAGLIVLVLDFVHLRTGMVEQGTSSIPPIAALGVAIFLGGLMQMGMAAFRLGPWFRAVSPAVVLGMLGGIGVVIVAKQIHEMIDDHPDASVIENIKSIPFVFGKVLGDLNDHTSHSAAAIVGLSTMLVLILWKFLMPKKIQLVPAALVAVVIGTLISQIMSLPVQRIVVGSNLADAITWLTPATFLALIQDSSVWSMAVAIAVIASAESLLCAKAVDQMHQGPRTQFNRELLAQGAGNMVCGILGALPMTGVIVRSSANVAAGAQTRWSATMHGLWLLLFVAFCSSVLGMIPEACLAAILVYTGIKLIEIPAVVKLWKESKSEVLIFLATLVGVVAFDLLTGVIAGVVLTALKLLVTFSHLEVHRQEIRERQEVRLALEGSATFVSLPILAKALDEIPRGWELRLSLEKLSYIDHACLKLIYDWEKQHESNGGKVFFDHDGLLELFVSPRNSSSSNNAVVNSKAEAVMPA
jgi:MFS superfamily sulfate permease-like transporter